MIPDTGQAAMARPFAEVLGEINHGIVADEAATALQHVVEAVKDTGKPGSIVLKIDVKPFSGNPDIVNVSGTVAAKAPKHPAAAAVFYTDDAGNLTRNDPRQLPIWNESEVAGGAR